MPRPHTWFSYIEMECQGEKKSVSLIWGGELFHSYIRIPFAIKHKWQGAQLSNQDSRSYFQAFRLCILVVKGSVLKYDFLCYQFLFSVKRGNLMNFCFIQNYGEKYVFLLSCCIIQIIVFLFKISSLVSWEMEKHSQFS